MRPEPRRRERRQEADGANRRICREAGRRSEPGGGSGGLLDYFGAGKDAGCNGRYRKGDLQGLKVQRLDLLLSPPVSATEGERQVFVPAPPVTAAGAGLPQRLRKKFGRAVAAGGRSSL